MRPVACLVLLAACASPDGGTGDGSSEPVFRLDGELACAEPVVDLEGGLHAHLLQSDDGGATFDYDPGRQLEARVEGRYDLVSGELAWTRTFAEAYFRAAEKVTGVGTAHTNGDLDVELERRVERRAGGFVVRHERVVRTGCDQQRVESTPAGEVLAIEDGTWVQRGYAYTTEVLRDGAKVTIEGLLARDRSRTESESWRVGDHEYVAETVDDGLGKVVVTYREVVGDRLYEGTITTRLNGSERRVFTETGATYAADWDYGVDVAGDGSGSVVFRFAGGSPTTCEVTVSAGSCRFACPGEDPLRC